MEMPLYLIWKLQLVQNTTPIVLTEAGYWKRVPLLLRGEKSMQLVINHLFKDWPQKGTFMNR